MVVAHQRHKSTGDMLVLTKGACDHSSSGRLSQHNLVQINKNYKNQDDDSDQDCKKTMPLLENDGATNRWTSCKLLDHAAEDDDDDRRGDEEESFLFFSGSKQIEEEEGYDRREKIRESRRVRRGKRQEFKSAGDLSLLFSLFQTQKPQPQQQQRQPDDKQREEEFHRSGDKTRARVCANASENKASCSPDRSIGQQQHQRARRADSNLASAASSPHLFALSGERTNSICDDATEAAGAIRPATCAGSRRRGVSLRAGAAQRRRQQAAIASHGQPVMKLPRVERRPVGSLQRTKPEHVAARQMTTSRDNNALHHHSSTFSLDGNASNCSARLGAPCNFGRSETDRGLESRQPVAAHKSHTTNNGGQGASVGETHRTAQVSGAFDGHSDSNSAQACVAQPSGCSSANQPGEKVMRAITTSTVELDNAGESWLLSFEGNGEAKAAETLHNRTQRAEQQLAATVTVGNHPPVAAGGQDASRCAPMDNTRSSPTRLRAPQLPLACQMAPVAQLATPTCATRQVECGTVSNCTNGANQSVACITSPDDASNATTSPLPGAQMDSYQLDTAAPNGHELRQVSSGQDQVRRVQAKNVNSSKLASSQEISKPHNRATTTSNVTSKLVDTCASSWRLALMATSGVTSSAGSYKVAQRERERAPEQPLQPLQQRRRQQRTQRQGKSQVAPADRPAQQRDSSLQGTNANASANASSNTNSDNENVNGNEYWSPADRYYSTSTPTRCEEVAVGEQELRQLDNYNSCRVGSGGGGTLSVDRRTTTTSGQLKPIRAQEATTTRGSQPGDTCHQLIQTTSSHTHKQHRLARPSRSPVSLQRQTNARLARHRLKIQQQRQEQLTRLALREREFCSSGTRSGQSSAITCSPSSSLSPAPATYSTNQTATSHPRRDNDTTLEIEILEQEQDSNRLRQNQVRRDDSSQGTSLLRGLLERLSLATSRVSGEHRGLPAVALVNFGAPASTRSRYQRQSSQRQQQVATAGGQSIAIEICDNNYPRATSNHRPPSVITFSASTGYNGGGDEEERAAGGDHTPERRRELRDMQQQLAGGGGGRPEHQQQFNRNKNKKNPETDSQCSTSSSSSSSTLSLNKPFCKICHLSSTGNESDKLISPCKCSGTMQYIHCGCLLKWLEISNRTNEGAISCELCAHEYTWHKRFNYKQMKLPKCSSKDILLHLIFLAALGTMLFCALAPIFNRSIKTSSSSEQQQLGGTLELQETARPNLRASFRNHFNGFQSTTSSSASNQQTTQNSGKLASDEKFILLCAAFFFISFFVAIYAQMKTRHTLYGLIVKFANMNLTYYITEYDHGASQLANETGPTNGLTPTDHDNKVAARLDQRYNQQQGNNNEQQRQNNSQVRSGTGGDTRRKGSA